MIPCTNLSFLSRSATKMPPPGSWREPGVMDEKAYFSIDPEDSMWMKKPLRYERLVIHTFASPFASPSFLSRRPTS